MHIRNYNLVDDKCPGFKRMVYLLSQMVEKCATVVCPGPTRERLVKNYIWKASMKLSRQQQTKNQVECTPPSIHHATTNSKWNRLTKIICTCAKTTKKSTIERRILRALLHVGMSRNDLDSLMKEYDFSFATGRLRIEAKADYDKMSRGESIKRKKKSYTQIDHNDIKKAVDFILSDQCVISTSYGVKEVILGGKERIFLPAVQRKFCRKDIIRKYQNYFQKDDSYYISTRVMYSILNAVTAIDEVSLYAIDYVTSLLVNETCEVLHNIAEKCIDQDDVNHATDLVAATKHFLKHHYTNHCMRENDGICWHGLNYGLNKDARVQKTGTNCLACKFPFYTCAKLSILVSAQTQGNRVMNDDAISVISDIRKKFQLYMAHVCRCRSQNMQIRIVEESMKNLCTTSRGSVTNGLMIIDFKMKFETQSTRESTLEHFGKRGIGWHGCALVYYLYELDLNKNNDPILDNDGKDKYIAKRYIAYIDQVLSESNKQDGHTVIGLLEVAMIAINNRYSFIREITLQSDNANTYQNHYVKLGI